ncbi:hypothetical protein NLI96_g10606 [Meripilus lineatus]|uniref:Uncharacterized protein n=1 Tax=Meripilus lineatus TaxID=2056292 RepID=A0AAD5UTC7_9APHY|nr:hypothetical protein NLI96_g10606 [Physisporinus lineatus]
MQTMSSFIHYIDPQPGVGGGPISQPASQFGADPEVQTMDSFVQFLDEPVVVQGNIPITQPPTGSTPSSNERADPRIFMTISELVTGNGAYLLPYLQQGSVGSGSDDNHTMSSFVQPVPDDLRGYNRDVMTFTYQHGELSVDQEFLNPANEERAKESVSMGDKHWQNMSRAGPSGSR